MNKNQHLLRNWIHRKVYCQYFCVFVAKASIWLKWETGKYWLCRTLLKMKRERVSPCLVSWLRSWLTFWVSLNLDYTNTTIKPFLICTFKISRLKQENSKQESCIHLWQVNWVLFCFYLKYFTTKPAGGWKLLGASKDTTHFYTYESGRKYLKNTLFSLRKTAFFLHGAIIWKLISHITVNNHRTKNNFKKTSYIGQPSYCWIKSSAKKASSLALR